MHVELDILISYILFVLFGLGSFGAGMWNISALTVGRIMVISRVSLLCLSLISGVMTLGCILIAVWQYFQGLPYEWFQTRVGAYGLLALLGAITWWAVYPKRKY